MRSAMRRTFRTFMFNSLWRIVVGYNVVPLAGADVAEESDRAIGQRISLQLASIRLSHSFLSSPLSTFRISWDHTRLRDHQAIGLALVTCKSHMVCHSAFVTTLTADPKLSCCRKHRQERKQTLPSQ